MEKNQIVLTLLAILALVSFPNAVSAYYPDYQNLTFQIVDNLCFNVSYDGKTCDRAVEVCYNYALLANTSGNFSIEYNGENLTTDFYYISFGDDYLYFKRANESCFFRARATTTNVSNYVGGLRRQTLAYYFDGHANYSAVSVYDHYGTRSQYGYFGVLVCLSKRVPYFCAPSGGMAGVYYENVSYVTYGEFYGDYFSPYAEPMSDEVAPGYASTGGVVVNYSSASAKIFLIPSAPARTYWHGPSPYAVITQASTSAAAGGAEEGPHPTSLIPALNSVCRDVRNLVPVVALLMFILAGLVYAAGQIFGAETRSRANVWSAAMLVGGVIGLVIAASAPYLLRVFAAATLGGISGLEPDVATCE